MKTWLMAKMTTYQKIKHNFKEKKVYFFNFFGGEGRGLPGEGNTVERYEGQWSSITFF